MLNALGGECLEDFERLREDQGLAEMLGHELPSPGAVRIRRLPRWIWTPP